MSDRPASPIAVRDARLDDRPAIAAIAAANDEPVEFPGVDGWPYLDHLSRRGRVVVAEREGRVIGFGASVPVGPTRHVSDLFVDPPFHGRGAGRAVLESLLAADVGSGWSTFSSADPRALPLFIRAGLQPYWPHLYLVATGTVDLDAPGGADVDRVSAEEGATTELGLTGIDRSLDYRYWSSVSEAATLVVRDPNGDVIAAGVARAMRRWNGDWLEHLTCAPGATEPMAAAAVVAALRALPDSASRGLCLPGPHPAVRVLLAAGFRIFDRDTFCATDPGIVDPSRHVLDSSLL